MGEFTFDTSGAVQFVGLPNGTQAMAVTWGHLSPFAQGYVEGAKQAHRYIAIPAADGCVGLDWAFRHLAPEALALILRDCEAYSAQLRPRYPDPRKAPDADALGGQILWRARQAGGLVGFPPLTPYLFDDGKVCLKQHPIETVKTEEKL